jgi:hypothetical protein
MIHCDLILEQCERANVDPASWVDREVCRRPSILQTNPQIYSEAIRALYSEVTGVLNGHSVPHLKPVLASFVRNPLKEVWHHNPLHGSNQTNAYGRHTYDTIKLIDIMEPQVFAGFKRSVWEWSFGH